MTSSYCLFPTRNTIKLEAFLSHNSHLHQSKHRFPFFSHETQFPKREFDLFLKPSLSLLRLKNYKLTYPFAASSAFAEPDGKEDGVKIQQEAEHQENEKPDEEELRGMAQAFSMYSLGQGMTLKTKFLSYATLLFGIYMAWNIGANDVANAMGTSVGSGALTLQQAVLTADVLEFSGALLTGRHVTCCQSFLRKG